MIIDRIISITTLLFDPIAAVVIIIFLVTDKGARAAPMLLRIGLALCAAGLLAQSHRSLVAFLFGGFPGDLELPFWVLKDWGLVVIALHFARVRWFAPKRG
jgi:hypothetical protein